MATADGDAAEAEAIGRRLGQDLRRRAGPKFFRAS
jgi:hypothetical protein